MKVRLFLAAAILTLIMSNPVGAATRRCGHWFETAFKAGWGPRHLSTLDYLLWRESRCQSQVVNKALNADGSWDYGLLQINDASWCKKTRWYPNGYLQSLGILDSCAELLNPYINLVAAKALYDYSGGWRPWGK